ncbi:MAG: pyridoxal-phosphate dependent enzyme [Planctomycetes bacterium]|nr:pyridoxal-phosphate dependent enzyme [Planctomycetota bacterium]
MAGVEPCAAAAGALGLEAVLEAATRIRGRAHRTPVLGSAWLDAATGATVFLKCENLQRTGSFKFRGAVNAVGSLSEAEARRGVATHSSGNHAAALALAARRRGVPATVVMPRGAPAVKRRAVAGYGARVVECEGGLAAREAGLARVLAETGAVPIHPYDDDRVIAGQGTAALELIQEVPDLDLVLAPVGGGGLLSGTALAVAAGPARIRVVGVEPAAADDARRSLEVGRILGARETHTVADGLRTALCERTYRLIRRHVEAIVAVEEPSIIAAMRGLWERTKLLVEPSSAVPVAAILEGTPSARGLRVGVIISGGNVDLDRLPWQEPS